MPEADRELARLLAEHDVPGAVLGTLAGSETTVVASGLGDVGSGEPVTPKTRFAVGSLAKSVLATAIARVGSLDDPVAARVPELTGASWAEAATLHDLLGNRALDGRGPHSASPRRTSTTRCSPSCGRNRAAWRSTAGSTPGASAGRASTGRTGLSTVGTG